MSSVAQSTTAAFFLVLTACGGPGATSPESRGNVETLNRSKCGACHMPRDPGVRTKEELVPILAKHRGERRATLTDDQWTLLTDYLAKK